MSDRTEQKAIGFRLCSRSAELSDCVESLIGSKVSPTSDPSSIFDPTHFLLSYMLFVRNITFALFFAVNE